MRFPATCTQFNLFTLKKYMYPLVHIFITITIIYNPVELRNYYYFFFLILHNFKTRWCINWCRVKYWILFYNNWHCVWLAEWQSSTTPVDVHDGTHWVHTLTGSKVLERGGALVYILNLGGWKSEIAPYQVVCLPRGKRVWFLGRL